MAAADAGPTLHPVISRFTYLSAFVTAGNVLGLCVALELIAESVPNFWQEFMGRFWLRSLTMKGIRCGDLAIVKCFCGERGVPPLADMQDDEVGTTLPLSKSPISL